MRLSFAVALFSGLCLFSHTSLAAQDEDLGAMHAVKRHFTFKAETCLEDLKVKTIESLVGKGATVSVFCESDRVPFNPLEVITPSRSKFQNYKYEVGEFKVDGTLVPNGSVLQFSCFGSVDDQAHAVQLVEMCRKKVSDFDGKKLHHIVMVPKGE